MNIPRKKNILGVDITSAREEEILEYIFSSVKNTHEKYFIATPNPEMIMYAHAHPEFKSILNKAEIALCDGIGISLAGSLLGKPIKSRITGVDLLESICKRSVKVAKEDTRNAVTVGFLGARKGVALKVAECLAERYPGLDVVFAAEEWTEDGFRFRDALNYELGIKNNGNEKSISHKPLAFSHSIDILFVAFGFPKQEEWMAIHIGKLPVRVMMGVGGAFDYISGEVSRAPKIVRSFGMEWLYRLIRQPWRLKRQLVLPAFMLAVLKNALSGK